MTYIKCLKCGYEWETRQKSYGHPKWCPSCKNPNWDSPVQKKEYDFESETVKVNLSEATLDSVFRCRKQGESYASAVDRLLEVPVLYMPILYHTSKRGKPIKTDRSVRVSKSAHEKLNRIKKDSKIKRLDEVLFRIAHNEVNRKYGELVSQRVNE